MDNRNAKIMKIVEDFMSAPDADSETQKKKKKKKRPTKRKLAREDDKRLCPEHFEIPVTVEGDTAQMSVLFGVKKKDLWFELTASNLDMIKRGVLQSEPRKKRQPRRSRAN